MLFNVLKDNRLITSLHNPNCQLFHYKMQDQSGDLTGLVATIPVKSPDWSWEIGEIKSLFPGLA